MLKHGLKIKKIVTPSNKDVQIMKSCDCTKSEKICKRNNGKNWINNEQIAKITSIELYQNLCHSITEANDYLRIEKSILETKLNERSRIKGRNASVISIMTYPRAFWKWTNNTDVIICIICIRIIVLVFFFVITLFWPLWFVKFISGISILITNRELWSEHFI